MASESGLYRGSNKRRVRSNFSADRGGKKEEKKGHRSGRDSTNHFQLGAAPEGEWT